MTRIVFWSVTSLKIIIGVFKMRSETKLILSTIAVLFFVASFPAQVIDGAKAAEQRAREVAEHLLTGNRAEYRKYIEGNFNDEMKKMPMERHLSFFSALYDSSRGYELLGVHESKANEVTMLAKNKLTGDVDGLLVQVDRNSPFKIAGLGMRRVPMSAGSGKLSNQEIVKQLDSFLTKLAEADVFSGSVLLAKDGRVIYKGAYGSANKDFGVPNRIDTKFNLGSMNKMFTAVAIAQLVERGKLSYDDPLSKFVPDFPNAEAARKIQIKHLLSHTAGLGGYFSPRYSSMSRAKLRNLDDMMALTVADEKDIQFEPGSKWQYSNTGMMVLGKVIEIVSGQSYYDFVRANIHQPAGMINTDCYELDKVNTNLAVGYEKEYTDNGIRWSNNIFEHVMRGGPQGGGYSTVEDLLRFDQALRSGKLISAESFKLLTSPKPELNSPRYGYGFFATVDGGPTGHSGGFTGISSNLSMFLGSGWTAVVMSNYGRAAQPISQKMNNLISASSN